MRAVTTAMCKLPAGPYLKLVAGWGLGFLVAYWTDRLGSASPVNDYGASSAAAAFVIGVGNAAASAWLAIGPDRPRCASVSARLVAGVWAVFAAAVLFDLCWALFVGIAPLPDTCAGGMDCIGEPYPAAPITGQAHWLLCATWIASLPMGLMALLYFTWDFGRRAPSAMG